ncbi:MAG: 1-(5-phosphoribosyl)-5-[(5-phosphoribosylamino)methylideneamino]imidazole-4-carboxamide isomerase [Candidatus Hydrogenedentota bacterium]|nr:MAG: 1-(5-phosphoribosyl)-5-[(5-phosphoribosylamino)methylideneamino]imidazole-4-carboxamide isomerase [Candidatus Hydrogenedentota bacterium]
MLVIPAIDIMNGKCVRLRRGEKDSRKEYSGDPVEQAKRWEDAGAQRIHVVDLDGAFEGTPKHGGLIREIVRAVKVPIEVGGGIRSKDLVRRLLDLGVAYAIIGTLAVEKPDVAAEIVEENPGQIYIGIDTRAGAVATRGWVQTSNDTLEETAERACEWGARGIVFTAIERDGEQVGPDLEAVRALTKRFNIPVIASGGVTHIDDLLSLAKIPNVEGAIVGKALYEQRLDLVEAIKCLEEE